MTRSEALSQYHQCAKRNKCPGEWKRLTMMGKRRQMRTALKAIRKNRKQARGITGRRALRSSRRNKK